jgi:hypothetical protein
VLFERQAHEPSNLGLLVVSLHDIFIENAAGDLKNHPQRTKGSYL